MNAGRAHSIPVLPLLLLLLFIPLFSLYSVPNSFLIVNQGHDGIVTALAMSADGNTGFSGDDRGVLRVWNMSEKRGIGIVRVGVKPIISIATHPLKNEAAVVEELGDGAYRLSVWDWENNRLAFAQDLDNSPLFVDYSPQGSFLMLALPQWRSLHFYDTGKAEEIPWLQDGIGIANVAVVSNSEIRVMAYNRNSGSIKYLELRTGNIDHETQAERGLSHFTLLANRRHALGYKNRNIYLIDLLTGATLASSPTGEVSAIIPAAADRFYIAQPNGRQHQLRTVNLTKGGSDFSIQLQQVAVTISGVDIHYAQGGGRTLVTVNKHEIALLENNRYHPLSVVETDKIRNILIQNDWLYIQTYAGINRILLKVLQDPVQQTLYIGAGQGRVLQGLILPVVNPVGMVELDGGRFIIWGVEEDGHIYVFDAAEEEFRAIPVELGAPVRDIVVGERYIIILDYSDGLYLLDKNDYSQLFSYQNVGMIAALELQNGRILIGRTRSNFLDASLIELDPMTGETVIVPNDDDIVFAFAPYPGGGVSLALNIAGGYVTAQQFNDNESSIAVSQLLIRFVGEDIGADAYFIPDSLTLVISAGFEGVSLYRDEGLEILAPNNHLPRRVYGTDRFIAAINDDGSVSFWDSQTLELKYQFVAMPGNDLVQLFPNAGWLSLAARGRGSGSGSGYGQVLSVPIGVEGDSAQIVLRREAAPDAPPVSADLEPEPEAGAEAESEAGAGAGTGAGGG